MRVPELGLGNGEHEGHDGNEEVTKIRMVSVTLRSWIGLGLLAAGVAAVLLNQSASPRISGETLSCEHHVVYRLAMFRD